MTETTTSAGGRGTGSGRTVKGRRARRDEPAEEDDVYVWWGKLRSPRREQELPHRGEVLALEDQIREGIDTHHYLTDHPSLYVARLVEITDDPVLEETPAELDHMPDYYQDHEVDFWFRAWDFRRLVHNDTPAVVEGLKALRNVRYHDRPVSLYGGLVDLPLLTWREEAAGWFDDMELLTGGRRWAERDATLRGETDRTARELRDNLLGAWTWHALEPATRTFLASTEAVFHARRDDPEGARACAPPAEPDPGDRVRGTAGAGGEGERVRGSWGGVR